MVTQNYDCYVNQAHVIRGNDVLMKCDIPSFVTDFVTLQNWQDNEENIISPFSSYGTFKNFYLRSPSSSPSSTSSGFASVAVQNVHSHHYN